jgi:hypothetical protein
MNILNFFFEILICFKNFEILNFKFLKILNLKFRFDWTIYISGFPFPKNMPHEAFSALSESIAFFIHLAVYVILLLVYIYHRIIIVIWHNPLM